MKIYLLLLTLIPLNLMAALDPYEDTLENLAPQKENNRSIPLDKSRKTGTWVYAFELLQEDGSWKILSENNRNLLVKPASTMKIFTGWFAFKKNSHKHDYLGKMLKESVNSMADATLKKLGGKKALKAFYAEEGLKLNSSNFIQADGSGLSYQNKTNCNSQIELLKLVQRDSGYETFKTLMAQPGEEGTLKTRLLEAEGKIFAKTGTLKQTASLSGFLETTSGTVVFCILSDYLPEPSRNYRPRIDAMVMGQLQALEN